VHKCALHTISLTLQSSSSSVLQSNTTTSAVSLPVPPLSQPVTLSDDVREEISAIARMCCMSVNAHIASAHLYTPLKQGLQLLCQIYSSLYFSLPNQTPLRERAKVLFVYYLLCLSRLGPMQDFLWRHISQLSTQNISASLTQLPSHIIQELYELAERNDKLTSRQLSAHTRTGTQKLEQKTRQSASSKKKRERAAKRGKDKKTDTGTQIPIRNASALSTRTVLCYMLALRNELKRNGDMCVCVWHNEEESHVTGTRTQICLLKIHSFLRTHFTPYNDKIIFTSVQLPPSLSSAQTQSQQQSPRPSSSSSSLGDMSIVVNKALVTDFVCIQWSSVASTHTHTHVHTHSHTKQMLLFYACASSSISQTQDPKDKKEKDPKKKIATKPSAASSSLSQSQYSIGVRYAKREDVLSLFHFAADLRHDMEIKSQLKRREHVCCLCLST